MLHESVERCAGGERHEHIAVEAQVRTARQHADYCVALSADQQACIADRRRIAERIVPRLLRDHRGALRARFLGVRDST